MSGFRVFANSSELKSKEPGGVAVFSWRVQSSGNISYVELPYSLQEDF
jgi:hypothetical protein